MRELFVIALSLVFKLSLGCGMPPANTHYLLYGMSFKQGNLWHSYEYAWQQNHHTYISDYKTIGVNLQHGRGHLSTGLVLEKRIPIAGSFLKKRSKKRSTIVMQNLLRYHFFPVIGINPNVHFHDQQASFNFKPRLGLMYQTNRENYYGGLTVRVIYGIDIPGMENHFFDYQRNRWLVQIGFSIPGRPKWH